MTLIWISLSLHLHNHLLLTLWVQTFTVLSSFRLISIGLFFLMTGWLPIRMHFITAWYNKQVKQHCEESICLAHMEILDLIMLTSKQLVPSVAARFKCMLSSLCVSKLSTVHTHKHTSGFSFGDDARVQYLPHYFYVSWNLYNKWIHSCLR